MKIIQEISERTMVANIQSLLETYPVDPSESYLSITGGYALNCPTNSKLMKEFGFRGFTSPPCVSDCGISYGIGLMMFYLRNPNFHFKLQMHFMEKPPALIRRSKRNLINILKALHRWMSLFSCRIWKKARLDGLTVRQRSGRVPWGTAVSLAIQGRSGQRSYWIRSSKENGGGPLLPLSWKRRSESGLRRLTPHPICCIRSESVRKRLSWCRRSYIWTRAPVCRRWTESQMKGFIDWYRHSIDRLVCRWSAIPLWTIAVNRS